MTGRIEWGRPPPRELLAARKRMNDAVRGFFDSRGFLEVETPIAVASPGLEPQLLAFDTEAIEPDGTRRALHLHTSPEYAMKRLLGGGSGSIYQIARVFRNGERSTTHTREFTMLEWYRSPGTLDALMDDVEALIRRVAEAVGGGWTPSGFERLSVTDAFARAGMGDPIRAEDTGTLRRALAVPTIDGDTWDDVFFRAMLDRVEPSFERARPTILFGWPARMAALSRIDPDDPQRCLRFEVYAGDLELANAFGELADPAEQRRRFERDLEVRRADSSPTYPLDEALLAALPGIGEAAGIALGVDRLLMLCLGAEAIQDVIPFAPR